VQYESTTLHEASFDQGLTETEGMIPANSADMVLAGSYEIELEKRVLYKVIEVKAPDNHEDFQYPEVPYQKGDRALAGNADNTYYVILNEADDVKTAGDNAKPALTDDQLTTLATSAGVSKEKIKVTTSNNPMLSVPNVRQITIGAKKTWEQDPNSAVNDVQVAVQLWRSNTKDIKDAKLVDNQKNLLADDDKTNFDDIMEAYILKKENAWTQEEIWHNLPNGNIDTEKPYYYFVKEVAYKIGNTWYKYNSTSGKFTDTDGNVWVDAAGNSAEYKPSYTDDATNSSGVIGIVNSRKLLVKKQWQDKNGKPITNPPVNAIDFNLYGITAEGTEVKITLPEDRQKLTAPNWEIEVPQDLISGEGIDYIKFRVEEVTELEDYIVSDVYALNGNTGVMYLINKNTNPTSVDVNVSKIWADGNDAHDANDAVTFTLYQFTGKQTVNQAFIDNFVKTGSYNGVTVVSGIDNPIMLDGTEIDSWQYTWKNLPFRGGNSNDKLQYFVVETQSDSTKDDYKALYSFDGNTAYKAERNLNVTNKQPGVLVVKKQWRDKNQEDHPIISNAKYPPVQVKLYRKEKALEQVANAEAADIMTKYGLNDADNLVKNLTDVAGLDENGTITLNQENAWTVSLKGLDDSYYYYIVEADGSGYTAEGYTPEYSNEGQLPGSDKIMTVDNFVEGETITVKAQKTWSYTDDDGTIKNPNSITLNLQQYDTVNKTWINVQSKTITKDSGTGWEAEWTDLPASKKYQVVEEVPDGWLPVYGKETVDTSGDTELRSYPVTNELDTTSLMVQKNWADGELHEGESITVRIHREISGDSADAKKNPLILNIEPADGSTIYLPKSSEGTQVHANVPVRVTVDGDDCLQEMSTVDAFRTWTVKPKSDATTGQKIDLTFTTEDGQTATVHVEIVDDPKLAMSLSSDSATLGSEAPTISLSYQPSVGDVKTISSNQASYEITEGDDVISIADGVITLRKEGTAKIRATYNGTESNNEVTLNVSLPDDFTFTATDNKTTVNVDEEVECFVNPNYGEFSYSALSSDGGEVTLIKTENGVKVKGKTAGTVTVTATRTDTKGNTKDKEITFTVPQSNITGTLNDRKQSGVTYDYVYNPLTHKITVTINGAFEAWKNGGYYPDFASENTLKNLVPKSFEIKDYSGGVQWHFEQFKEYNDSSNPFVNQNNTKKFSELTDDYIALATGGTYTIEVIVDSTEAGSGSGSSEGGNESGTGGNSENTDGFTRVDSTLNNNVIGNVLSGSTVEVKISGEPNAGYNVSLGGDTTPEGNSWKNNTNEGNSGNLDSSGNATISITAQYDFYSAQLQQWYYSVGGSNLTLVSYKITPPANSTNSLSTLSRSPMTRFSSRNLRMSAALDYTSLPLAAPQSTSNTTDQRITLAAAPESAEQLVFTNNGTIDIVISGNWQKTISGLPKYTYENGVAIPYYYWVEEINSPNYKASYSFTDGDSETDYSINAANPGANPLITIKNTPTESPSVELPESGSTGTKIYYLTGGILLLLSAAGYITYTKRRRWFNE